MKTQNLDRAFLDRIKKDGYARGLPFVTLSRQAGAGGHDFAEAIRARTNERAYQDVYRDWMVFDKEISEALSRDPRLTVNMRELLAEEYNNAIVDFFRELAGKKSSQYTVAVRTFELVRTIATFGKVIIVGRAGSLVTHDFPAGIRIRLTAPLETRIQRMARLFSLTETEAYQMIQKQDGDRARMVRNFFNRDIDDPTLYDAVWTTDDHSLNELADQAIDLIEAKRKELGTP